MLDMVTIEYAYGYCEQVPRAESRGKLEESAVEDPLQYPLHWEKDPQGEFATQQHPYFDGQRRFVGRIYN